MAEVDALFRDFELQAHWAPSGSLPTEENASRGPWNLSGMTATTQHLKKS